MNDNLVIALKEVSKKFGDRLIVRDLSLDIFKSECIGLLGPNGAGKTTTLKMMNCSLNITAGEIYVLGLNAKNNGRQIKSRIGIVPQSDGLDLDFNVIDNLVIFASYFGIPHKNAVAKAQSLLRQMRLEEYSHRDVETLSGGQKRKLTIARALMNDPEILFLDEPTSGLDPQTRIWIWRFLTKFKNSGKSIVLATHYIEEAESICDRVVIIDQGKIVTSGSPDDLIHQTFGKKIIEFEVNTNDLNYYLNRIKEFNLPYLVIGNSVIVQAIEQNESKLVNSVLMSDKVLVRKPSLSDVFLKLTGHLISQENYHEGL